MNDERKESFLYYLRLVNACQYSKKRKFKKHQALRASKSLTKLKFASILIHVKWKYFLENFSSWIRCIPIIIEISFLQYYIILDIIGEAKFLGTLFSKILP